MAGNALTDPALRNRLGGNLALVNADNISVVDTRTGLGMGGVSVNPEATSQPVAPIPTDVSATSAPAARPNWILPVVGVLVFLIIAVLIVALISSRRDALRG
jgi:hypothetical protein